MQKRLVTLALGLLCLPALGIAAYGVAHSVSDTPSAQVVIPANSNSSADVGNDRSNRNASAVLRADDSAALGATSTSGPGHHAVDGTQRSTTSDSSSTTLGHSNDAPGHDTVVVHGGAGAPGTTDPVAGHEVGGVRGGTVTTITVVTTATTVQKVSGSGRNGSSSGTVGGSKPSAPVGTTIDGLSHR